MTYEEAAIRARMKAWKYRPLIISRLYETDESWVFSLSHPEGEMIFANIPYLVFDKNGRRGREIMLPSPEGFALIDKMRPIDGKPNL